MAATDRNSRRRFAVACGVISRCVRAEAETGQMAAAHARPATTAVASTMLLMPGADVAPDVSGEAEAAPAQAQLMIMYGGRVLVFVDVPADRAADLLRVAARDDVLGGTKDIPVARKASLQRFMEKRRDRLVAQGPYDTANRQSVACKKRQQEGDADAGAWLGLGIPGRRVH